MTTTAASLSLTVWILLVTQWLENVGVVGVTPLPIQLSVKQACDDWVLVTYQPNPPLPEPSQPADKTFSACDLKYWSHTDKLTSIRVLYNYPTARRDIRIHNLSPHTTYIIYMSCDQQFRSNNVTFTSGSKCAGSSKEEEVYSTPVVLEEKGLTQMSTIDITLGVVFGIFGAVILAAAAYYFWKNHQRRQRILRVFGQTHTDPFEALHNSMEESSIISL